MGGWLTDNMGQVGPLVQNTTTVNPVVGYTNLSASALIPVDTNLASGGAPQTVAATPFAVASFFSEMFANQGTSTVHAITLNTVAGYILTESVSTAAGATYTFTLTNSLLVAGAAAPQVQVHSGTNTGGGFQITSVVNATGSTVISILNTGTTAFNGTLVITFHI
jgi:hypothetical protein